MSYGKLLINNMSCKRQTGIQHNNDEVKPVEVEVTPMYENTKFQFQVVNSVPSDHAIDPKWISQAYERVKPLRPRRHPPGHYEFPSARYWPHRNSYVKAETQLGYPPLKPGCSLVPSTAGPHPPDARVPHRRHCQPEPSVQWLPTLPPYKVPDDRVVGLYPNLWCRRWGSSLAEDAFSHCPSCNCYVQPPVTSTSYLDVDRRPDNCARDKPCYYNAYKRHLPPMPQPIVQPTPTAEDMKTGQPPPRWWITFEQPNLMPPPTDYRQLIPRAAPPPCYSRFEINGVSDVKSQWIA